ncbi:MAG: LysR substrate-binding domain-containing protein [Variovorax sp.]
MREIQAFRAVMQTGTTSKAAALLDVSQPAISQAIRKLELDSGLRLFERVRGRLVPTQEAALLMVDVDRYFTGFELIEHRIRSLRNFGVGRLSIAAFPALGTGFMPRAIQAFDLPARRIQMSFQIMSSREVYRQVSSGRLDFGLMADELPVAGLEHSSFLEVDGVVVMHAQHPLASRRMVSVADLAAHPFIALNPEDRGRQQLERAVEAEGEALRPIIETPYSHSICEFALRGLGIGMVHPITALDHVARGLVLKPMAIPVKARALLVFRPGVPLSDNAKLLLKAMRIQMDADLRAVEAQLAR